MSEELIKNGDKATWLDVAKALMSPHVCLFVSAIALALIGFSFVPSCSATTTVSE